MQTISLHDIIKKTDEHTGYNLLIKILLNIKQHSDYIKYLKSYFTSNTHNTPNNITNTIITLVGNPTLSSTTAVSYGSIPESDYYDLVKEENPDLTSENIEKYILLISKFMMTKTILRKGIEIKGEYETGEQYKELIKLLEHNAIYQSKNGHKFLKYINKNIFLKFFYLYLKPDSYF